MKISLRKSRRPEHWKDLIAVLAVKKFNLVKLRHPVKIFAQQAYGQATLR